MRTAFIVIFLLVWVPVGLALALYFAAGAYIIVATFIVYLTEGYSCHERIAKLLVGRSYRKYRPPPTFDP